MPTIKTDGTASLRSNDVDSYLHIFHNVLAETYQFSIRLHTTLNPI